MYQRSLNVSDVRTDTLLPATELAPLEAIGQGCVPRSVEKERHPPLRHQSIISGGNLRVFENLAQTLVSRRCVVVESGQRR